MNGWPSSSKDILPRRLAAASLAACGVRVPPFNATHSGQIERMFDSVLYMEAVHRASIEVMASCARARQDAAARASVDKSLSDAVMCASCC